VVAQLYNIFPNYLINDKIFEKKVIEPKICIFSLQLSSEIFLTLRRIEQDITKWQKYSQKTTIVVF